VNQFSWPFPDNNRILSKTIVINSFPGNIAIREFGNCRPRNCGSDLIHPCQNHKSVRCETMTKQEFHHNLYDSMTQRFRSLDENCRSFLDSLIKQIREGRLSTDHAVIALAHAVEMLGLRIQYLQSKITAFTRNAIYKIQTRFRPGYLSRYVGRDQEHGSNCWFLLICGAVTV